MTALRISAASIAVVLAALAAAPALAITADVSVNQSSGVAPLAVFFDGRGTSDPSRNDTATFLDLYYTWDFGDDACVQTNDKWQMSGKSKCIDLGPVAGHVYEVPGTYTAELTVTDGVETRKQTVQITVEDPDVVFAGQKTVCVSRNGDFSDPNGVCNNARRVTSTSNLGTILAQNLVSGERLLLRRGDAWSGGSWTYSGNGPTVIGAYGVGAKPRIDQGAAPMIRFSSNSGLRVMDLAVHGNDDPDEGSVVYTSGNGQAQNVLVLRVDAVDLAKPFQLQVNGGPTPLTGYMNNGVAIVESTTDSRAHGSGNNDFFGGGERMIFMGNDFGNADGTEHTLRFQYLKGAVVSHNRMGRNVPDKKAVIKMHNIFDAAPCTEEVMLADNRAISGGAANVWGLGPQNTTSPDECIHLLRIERNHITFTKANAYRQIQLQGGASLIANNILDLTGSDSAVRPHGIIIHKRMSSQTTPANDNRILNNTCYMGDQSIGVKCVVVQGSNNKSHNNLIYAPSIPVKDVTVFENQSGSSSNTSSGDRIASSNPFDSANPSAWGDYTLGSGGASMIDAGTPLPSVVGSDFTGTGSRVVNGTVDVGAHEWRGGSGDPHAPTLLD
ncbi:MAG: PKD domain-containing protein [Myxococcota bacterium]